MKFGIVGIGKFGRNYIKNLNEIDGAELIACSSRTEESYNSLPLELSKNLPWTNDFEKLLKLRTDTIIIATHPDSHFKYARAALEHGKNVICEKPCMFSPDEFEIIRRVSQSNGGCFFTNYLNSYSSVYPKIHQSIQDNDFSLVTLMNVGNGPRREYSSLWDYGSHEIAFAYTVNACSKGEIDQFEGKNDRYYLSIRFPKSLVMMTVGSGFPSRLNTKQCINKRENIKWMDKKEEPLLKRVLSSFVEQPVSNLDISIEVSRIINQL